jgi:signal transduction histidine kinase
VRDAVDRSERLIEGLLTLARSEQALTRHEPVDLAQAAALSLKHMARETERLALHPVVALGPAPAQGDKALLERLVANLVENAVRYNRPGGTLSVRTAAETADTVLLVENDGPVIPSGAVEELFLPFRRGSGDRVGSATSAGLGLAIARSIATAHGGTLTAQARDAGGLRVELRLPRRPT